MLQVGEVSRRLGLNPQTLSFYERIGLVSSLRRTAAGCRLYNQADLDLVGVHLLDNDPHYRR